MKAKPFKSESQINLSQFHKEQKPDDKDNQYQFLKDEFISKISQKDQ